VGALDASISVNDIPGFSVLGRFSINLPEGYICVKGEWMKIGSRVRFFRQRIGLTQREFSKLIGYSQSMVALIETNKNLPSLEALYKIAKVLKVEPHIFLMKELPVNI
jgi:DNA-binding XRE family transcriptional regulator